MNCIFCKCESSSSRSVEHIVPESLGNKSHTLPPGVVCDRCNNYFARKIEKPLLDSGTITALRHSQAIPNKRGRIPSLDGVMLFGSPMSFHACRVHRRSHESEFVADVDVDTETFQRVLGERRGQLILMSGHDLPSHEILSRFLAKMAVEAFAHRLLDVSGDIQSVVSEPQLDAIRNHARMGQPKHWPHTTRRIYDANAMHIDAAGTPFQTLHEFDFFFTPNGELYFVVAILGVEFAINLGGPFVDSYESWLSQNPGLSPLYIGKNQGLNDLA